MILFFSGVFATVGLFAMLGAGYMLGQRSTPKPERVANDDDEARKQQIKLKKAFDNLMSYDLDKAYARKVN